MADHITLGKKGEDIAAKHLSGLGYQIVERNWRFEKDEIDIIAMDGEFLVFVEVKTRSSNWYGEPYEAVDDRKEKLIVRGAEAYVVKKDLYNEVRFDIVSIVIDGNKQTINHMKEAFYPGIGEYG
ncbi:MAG: YraN family protein [Bacteroidales bacterium]|nr:YraN family protein [Bacteroidales bacterium]